MADKVIREGTTQPITFTVTTVNPNTGQEQPYDLSDKHFIFVLVDATGTAQSWAKSDPGWGNRFAVQPNGQVGVLVFYPEWQTFRAKAGPYKAFLWVVDGTERFSLPKDPTTGNDTEWTIEVLPAYGVIPG